MVERLDAAVKSISDHVQNVMQQIDTRSKDVQAYVIRKEANKIKAPTEELEISTISEGA